MEYNNKMILQNPKLNSLLELNSDSINIDYFKKINDLFNSIIDRQNYLNNINKYIKNKKK